MTGFFGREFRPGRAGAAAGPGAEPEQVARLTHDLLLHYASHEELRAAVGRTSAAEIIELVTGLRSAIEALEGEHR